MNAEIFAEWFRRQGYQVARTESSYWVNLGKRVYQAFPYHWLIQPAEAELQEFIQSQKALALRYSTLLEAPVGCLSYHATYDNPSYDLNNLGKWARKNVRRGLKNCEIEEISLSRLAGEGWQLQVDTLDRQGRKVPMSARRWGHLCLSMVDLSGFKAWGAMVQGELAASVVTFQMDDCAYMLYQQCQRRYIQDHVNNALSFTVTKWLVEQKAIRSILYGLHSLDAPASVDEFKFRMGYVPKPVRQRVVFHPSIQPVINRLSHALVRNLLKLTPGNPTLGKAEGMLRFYLEGLRPLEEQNCPEILRKRLGA
ncbi:MAG: hypothetical protein ACLQUW_13855 [Desulfobaccales bacterium]